LKEIYGVLTTRNPRKSSVEMPQKYTVFERNFCNPFVTSTQKRITEINVEIIEITTQPLKKITSILKKPLLKSRNNKVVEIKKNCCQEINAFVTTTKTEKKKKTLVLKYKKITKLLKEIVIGCKKYIEVGRY
jgi:hypothetical protein